ncbi:ABC transporter, permease protein [Streptococcus infantis SK1302]|uniref:ABC transporter, permease protein n=1 Tax=Streptococcus infantis SK1302 TaxID=871237 RepID=A0ABP2J3V4_9STRE|nr:ABC transporter, permease protein [Streptococcus infantis SK1302]
MMVVVQTIPTIAIAPILVLWLGYGILPKIVLIILTTTFPIIVSILDGFRHCDKDMLTLFSLMRANPWQILWHFKNPCQSALLLCRSEGQCFLRLYHNSGI